MKRMLNNFCEGGTQTKRRRHLSASEDEEVKYTPSVLRQMTEPPPMSKIYNSSFRNNKPAELFRKDLISAMKVADSEQLMPEDYWVMVDAWKQEWEKGVQVPVNPNALPRPTFRKIIRPKAKHGDFKLPKKLIRCTHDEFFSNDLHVLTNVAARAEKVCRYDADDVDSRWLEMLNQERDDLGLAPITESDVELIMEEFENQCANSLQEAIRKEEGLGIEFDEDVICDVCRSPDSEDGNEMVFCDSCNICVHQACYGITTIPEGSWVCRTCALGIRPPCVLCPNRGGAMKSTRSGQKWAHVSCALWVPEVSIGCVEKMEPITKICHIPASRWALVCSICRERSGACIQCSVKTCKTAYHITCAFKDGLQMKAIIDEENEEDGVKLRSFCEKHSKKKDYASTSGSECEMPLRKSRELEMSSEEKAGVRAQRIRVLEDEFYRHVVTRDLCSLLKMDPVSVDFVYQYWKLKRKANWNRALLTPRAEESDLLVKQQEDSLYARMKMFVHLRQDLERVRNLCYMVSRREKLSRSFFRIREDTFRKQAALLGTRGGPKLSDREREAILRANRCENVYDRLYAADPEDKVPSLQAVVCVLQGKDTDLYSSSKSPRKTPEPCRLPNPYAKQYPNGIRRSHRRFASLFESDDPSWPDSTAGMLEPRTVRAEDSVSVAGRDRKDSAKGDAFLNKLSESADTAQIATEPEGSTTGRCRRKNGALDARDVQELDDEGKNSELTVVSECDVPVVRSRRKNPSVDESQVKKSPEILESKGNGAFLESDDAQQPKTRRKNANLETGGKEILENTDKLSSQDIGLPWRDCNKSKRRDEGRRLRSGDKAADSENTSPCVELGRNASSHKGPLSGYRIPKRVQTETTDRGHLPVSPLSSVAEYHKPRYNSDRSPVSPRLVIKLRKDPQEVWQGHDRFQVVRNDWDSQGRKSERHQQQRKVPYAYDRYRFRTALHRPEFFS